MIPKGQGSITIRIEGHGWCRFKEVLTDKADLLEDGTYEVRDKKGRIYIPNVVVEAEDDDEYVPLILDSCIECYHAEKKTTRKRNMEKWLIKHFNGNIHLYLTNKRWLVIQANLLAMKANDKATNQKKDITTLKRGQTNQKKVNTQLKKDITLLKRGQTKTNKDLNTLRNELYEQLYKLKEKLETRDAAMSKGMDELEDRDSVPNDDDYSPFTLPDEEADVPPNVNVPVDNQPIIPIDDHGEYPPPIIPIDNHLDVDLDIYKPQQPATLNSPYIEVSKASKPRPRPPNMVATYLNKLRGGRRRRPFRVGIDAFGTTGDEEYYGADPLSSSLSTSQHQAHHQYQFNGGVGEEGPSFFLRLAFPYQLKSKTYKPLHIPKEQEEIDPEILELLEDIDLEEIDWECLDIDLLNETEMKAWLLLNGIF